MRWGTGWQQGRGTRKPADSRIGWWCGVRAETTLVSQHDPRVTRNAAHTEPELDRSSAHRDCLHLEVAGPFSSEGSELSSCVPKSPPPRALAMVHRRSNNCSILEAPVIRDGAGWFFSLTSCLHRALFLTLHKHQFTDAPFHE